MIDAMVYLTPDIGRVAVHDLRGDTLDLRAYKVDRASVVKIVNVLLELAVREHPGIVVEGFAGYKGTLGYKVIFRAPGTEV